MTSNAELRKLLSLSWPISLSFLGGIAMQLVDAMFIGRLGAESMAAVSLANAVYTLPFVIGLGVLSSLDYFIARDFGAELHDECRRWTVQGLWLALATGGLFSTVMLFSGKVYHLFGINGPEALLAEKYMNVLAYSMVPFFLFSVLRQGMQAYGIARPALWITIIANGVNAIFNWAFIYGHLGMPQLGMRGAAVATFGSRMFMLVAMAWVYAGWLKERGEKFEWKRPLIPVQMKLLKLGAPAGGHMLLEVGAFSFASMLAGKLGAVWLASHQIVLNVASTVFMIPLGISSAAAVLVGQAIGEGRRDVAIARGWLALKFSAVVMVCIGVVAWLVREPVVHAFTSDADVAVKSIGLMWIVTLFQLFDATQVVGAGVLRGAGRTHVSFISNFVGHWLIGVPLGMGLCFALGYGLTGLWVGLLAGLAAVAALLVVAWRQEGRKV